MPQWLGLPEIILILVVLVLVFGARRLPEIARSLGRSKGEFKKGLEEGDSGATKPEEPEKAETD